MKSEPLSATIHKQLKCSLAVYQITPPKNVGHRKTHSLYNPFPALHCRMGGLGDTERCKSFRLIVAKPRKPWSSVAFASCWLFCASEYKFYFRTTLPGAA